MSENTRVYHLNVRCFWAESGFRKVTAMTGDRVEFIFNGGMPREGVLNYSPAGIYYFNDQEGAKIFLPNQVGILSVWRRL